MDPHEVQDTSLTPNTGIEVDPTPVPPPTLTLHWADADRDNARAVLSSSSALVKIAVKSWLAAARTSFVAYVTAMFDGGHWPDPLTSPDEVEARLAFAAGLLATSGHCLFDACPYPSNGTMLALSVLSWELESAGLADMAVLRGRPTPDRSVATSPTNAPRVRVLAIEDSACSVVGDLGVDLSLNWSEVTLRVLRDAILESIPPKIVSRSGTRWFECTTRHGPHQLPIRVAIPVAAVPEPNAPKRRRRT